MSWPRRTERSPSTTTCTSTSSVRAAPADPALVDPLDVGHAGRDAADLLLELGRRRRVHDVDQRRTEEVHAVERDHQAREQRGPVIGCLVTRSSDQRDGDADEGGERGEGVGAMVPGVGLQGRLSMSWPVRRSTRKRTSLVGHHRSQHEQGERRGCPVRSDDLVDALDGNAPRPRPAGQAPPPWPQSDSARPCPYGWFSSGGREATFRLPSTTSELKMSINDSTPSAMRA